MSHRYTLSLLLITLFTACGNTPSTQSIHTDVPSLESESNQTFVGSNKTVTVYVHGFDENGQEKEHAYGLRYYDTFRSNLVEYTGYTRLENYEGNTTEENTHLITAVDYYGHEAPEYYDDEDRQEIEAITTQYGGGVPRYASIVAKFIHNVLDETQAERVNIVSVSLGSLITRWMIEKDVEHLASEQKIEKWMSVEGVIRGNYALSSVNNSSIINLFLDAAPELDQMKYDWIEEHLTPHRATMSSPYYQDILVGQISLTDGSQQDSMLSYVFPLYGGFQPNDGFQILKDTYFESADYALLPPTHTLLHDGHLNIKNNHAAFAAMSYFLEAQKRVRITLTQATVNAVHEVAFESSIFSANAQSQWELESALDERLYSSGALASYTFEENSETQTVNQVLFDAFVMNQENQLKLSIEGLATDANALSLGKQEINLPLTNGTYPVTAQDWNGTIAIEVLELDVD
ncbi:MAG TPA: hypothetical protein ENK86_03825 [Campylobacterales bacterium]|nr:hypothetical protein [Campylobacterales bacterium]